MDKQKQIEELAKDLVMAFAKPLEKCLYPESTDCKGKSCERFNPKAPCRFMNIAENLYNAGYRKIDENAVVLTREEKADLFDCEAGGFMTSAIGDIPLNIDGMRKLVDEVSRLYIVQAELQELNAKYYNEAKDLRRKLNNDGAIYSRLEVDGFIDKARKETAEKFAERVFDLFATDKQFTTISRVTIREIAKEITEGTK